MPFVHDALPEQHVCPLPTIALFFRQLIHLLAPCQRGFLLALYVLVTERRLCLGLNDVDGERCADEEVWRVLRGHAIRFQVRPTKEVVPVLMHFGQGFDARVLVGPADEPPFKTAALRWDRQFRVDALVDFFGGAAANGDRGDLGQ